MPTVARSISKSWLLSRLKKLGHAARAGCNPATLAEAKLRLRAQLDIGMPAEYGEVLSITNGFAVPGAQLFYVVDPVSDDPAVVIGHVATEVTANNLHYRQAGLAPHYFICGTAREHLIAYDDQTGLYVILDPYDFETLKQYHSLRSLLEEALAPAAQPGAKGLRLQSGNN